MDKIETEQQLFTTGPAKLRRFPKYLNRVHSPLPLYYLIKLPIIPEFPGLSFERNKSINHGHVIQGLGFET